MCGILGVSLQTTKPEELQVEIDFCRLVMNELCTRGTHAIGICYYADHEYHIFKTPVTNPAKTIEVYLQQIVASGAKQFIYHNRYSTSGDYSVYANNQPILVPNVGAIAMNGVLSMATKPEYEAEFGVKCECDNDAEVFLRIVEKGEELPQFLKRVPKCSYAGVILSHDVISGLRNNKRPLYTYYTKNAFYIVSTIDAIYRAGGDIFKAKVVDPFKEVVI